MKTISDSDYAAIIRAGKVMAKHKVYTEDTKLANAIRNIIKISKKYAIQSRKSAARGNTV